MSEQEKNIESIYPLSPMQQGMLFYTLLSPKSGVYFNQVIYTLTGRLQEAAMQRAWQAVAGRHEPLRTLFVWEGREKPLQVVRRRVTLPCEELDWRGISADEQNWKRAAFLQADRQHGFDLAQAPLMRLAMVRLGENHYELIWSHHHLLMDGWSSFLILKDVMAIYQALSEGRDCRLAPVRPYHDYISWLQRQDLSKAEGFWRAALKGFAAPTPLLGSSVHGKDGDQDFQAADLLGSLPLSLTAALRAFASRHGLTLSTIVQGAWAILLSRYSGEQDIVFGSTVSGRPAELAGVELMAGLFINTLPVRAQLSSEDLTLAWLKDFQDKLAEMRQYEHTPLVEAQGWSEVGRDRQLFESLMVFENYPVDALAWGQVGALQISNMRVIGPTNYPLAIVVVPKEEFSIRVSYDPRRFEEAAISRMLGHFNTLLEGIVANPDGRLTDLPLLTSAERQQLLVEWNRTEVAYPKDRCLHGLFEDQVEQTPDGVAVVFEDQQLSYRQLNERANQLARHLRRLGVGPNTLVGICVERSLEMVVGLLGILKAGGAYVPLDPSYPTERLAFMLSDAQMRVLLTRQSIAGVLPAGAAQVVYLDTQSATVARHAAGNLETPTCPDQLAYVTYTSGSTGRPKGVCGEHRATLNRLRWMWRKYPFAPGERCCQKTVLSFVDSVWEIFGPLLRGVATVLIPEPVVRDPRWLVAALAEAEVTRIVLVPSLLQALLDEYEDLGARLPRLSHWTISGEALAGDLAERFFEQLPGRLLLNLYGSSEVAADATWFEVTPKARPGGVPIGRPIDNMKAYILDGQRRLTPIGATGELYLGGAGLARGYLRQPELTHERFLANPFDAETDRVLYKTGDLARYARDGIIEYVGRGDHQVKIRGFRIELGEIELVLASHPMVREAVVLAREDVPSDKRLAAYLTVTEGEPPRDLELRGLLRAKLPEYMIPSAFVVLDRLPLTPNGKVDRKALPRPDLQPSNPPDFEPPGTEAEKVLADIWSQVLRIHHVGVHDNFFELGGHSLLATRVAWRATAEFGVRLPLRTLFEHPTLAGLAEHIDALLWAGDHDARPHFHPAATLEEGIL